MKKLALQRLSLTLSPIALLAVIAAPVYAKQAEPAAPPSSAAPQVPAPAPAANTPANAAWHVAGKDVPADPNILYRVLPNGMKYAIMKNATPPNGAAISMMVDVGSLAEDDDQRGLAHFLEHMAFNGSKAVPEGELIPLLGRKGIRFGADSNASTGFDVTEYTLSLPQATEDLLDTGLMLMRETASELTIAPEAVERERGVVQAERRARDNYAMRNLVDQIGFFAKGTSLVHRLPIGTEQIIRTAPAQRIRDFYRDYYRPERTTLVIVGDFDPAVIDKKIQERFADWRAAGTGKADPNIGQVDLTRPIEASLFIDPAIQDSVTIMTLKPFVEEADSLALRNRSRLEGVATNILQRRFANLAMEEGSPILDAQFGVGDNFDAYRSATLSATVRDGRWAEAMALVEQELRRAVDHGFTDAEVKEQLAVQQNALKNAVSGASTRRNEALVRAIIFNGKNERVMTHPEWQLANFEAMMADITSESVTQAFRKMTEGFSQPLLRVTAKKPVEGGTQALLDAYRASQAKPVTAPEDKAVPSFAYDDYGKAGQVVSDERVADLNIRRIRFANNVMLNIKQTDFEKGRANMVVRVDGGQLLATKDDPTRVSLADYLTLGGLDAHSVTDMRSILAGRTVSTTFSAGEDAFIMGAATTPTDLAFQAKVSAAYLLHPGYRSDGLAVLRSYLPQVYAAMDATPAAVINRDFEAIITGQDPRKQTPTLEKAMSLDWKGLEAAMADSLTHGAIEIGIVGDVDEQAAIDAIAASFGALPERRAAFAAHSETRDLKFATDFTPQTLIHTGDAEQAEVRVVWPATDNDDLTETLKLNLLSEVMQAKLLETLREELGVAYSPIAGASLSSVYPDFGFMLVGSNVEYGQIAATRESIMETAQALRDKPVDAALLESERKSTLEQMTIARKRNNYWLPYVSQAASKPERLERINKAHAILENITAAQVQETARTYLQPDKALVITAQSDKAGKAPAAASATVKPAKAKK